MTMMQGDTSFHLSALAKIPNLDKTQCWPNCGEARGLCCRWWGIRWGASLGETLVMSPRIPNASVLPPSLPICGGLAHRHSCIGVMSPMNKVILYNDGIAAALALGTHPRLTTGEGRNTLWYVYPGENCSSEKEGNLCVGMCGQLQDIVK